MPGFPIATGGAVRASPTVWDIDIDGDEELVIYGGNEGIWARPKEMFFEVLSDGRPRFERIDEKVHPSGSQSTKMSR